MKQNASRSIPLILAAALCGVAAFASELPVRKVTLFKKRKEILIRSRGTGTRRIAIAYLVPAPVWRSTYRLTLAEGRLSCQGWAAAYNNTGEDWTDIQLEFVSRTPLSFGYGIARPVLAERAKMPEGAEQVLNCAVESQRAPNADLLKVATQMSADDLAREGKLFTYRIQGLVSIPANESALLPFFERTLEASKAVLWDLRESRSFAFNALRVKNDSDLVLDGGMCSLYEDGVFKGESFLRRISPGEADLVVYGRVQEVKPNCYYTSEPGAWRKIRLEGGKLTLFEEMREVTHFQVLDGSDAPRPLVVRVTRRNGDSEVDTALKVLRREPGFFEAEVSLQPGKLIEFTFTEVILEKKDMDLKALDEPALETFRKRGLVSGDTLAGLEQIAAWNRKMALLTAEGSDARKETDRIGANQGRLRQNLRALGASDAEKALRDRYVKQLGEEEQTMQQLSRKVEEVDTQMADLSARREKTMKNLRWGEKEAGQ